MITSNVFEDQWQVLTKFYRRDHDPQIKEIYYASLSEELTDEQFLQICQQLLKTNVRFPLLAEFLVLRPMRPPNAYRLPEGAIDIRTPNSHDPVAWATAALKLPNHPRWGNIKRRAQAILEEQNVTTH
jgi:hypothetical protein